MGNDSSIDILLASKDRSAEIADRILLDLSANGSNVLASTEEMKITFPFFEDSESIPIGTVLGHFRVEKFIGGGGMGRVYLGFDMALARNVAIKVLPKHRSQDAQIVARFMNEARSAARLNHEHIAQVYFAGEHNGVPFIAFEYVEGINVRALTERHGVLPLHRALNYLIQITHALAHASHHGVIHRDVKPSNIIITSNGQAKLIDMGLARLLKSSDDSNELTASGTTLGTFDYISPEQAMDPRNADIRSDIYSLGCTFYYMLTGRPPFSEGTVLQKLLQHQAEDPPDIRALLPRLPEDVAVILKKMMAKDPKSRFQDPTLLLRSLEALAVAIGLKPIGSGKMSWGHASTPKNAFWLRHAPWIVSISSFFFVLIWLQLFWNSSLDSINLPPNPDFISAHLPSSSQTLETPERPLEPAVSHTRIPNEIQSLIRSKNTQEQGAGHFSSSGNIAFKDTLSFGLSAKRISTNLLTFAPVRHVISTSNTPLFSTLAAAPTAPATHQTLIVDPTTFRSGSFPSLESAIAFSTKIGSTAIELHFDSELECKPFQITNNQLTIRAGKGNKPKLIFRPTDSSVLLHNTGSMITLNGNELFLDGIELKLVVPTEIPTDSWTLFDIPTISKISALNCRFTIENVLNNKPFHSKVAFFRCSRVHFGLDSSSEDSVATGAELRVLDTPAARISGGKADETIVQRCAIRISNSLIRGEATTLLCDFPDSAALDLENVFVATSLPFIIVREQKRPISKNAFVQVSLAKVSLYSRSVLFRHQKEKDSTGSLLPLRVAAVDSIFSMNGRPIAETMCVSNRYDAKDAIFNWSGKQTFFENVAIAWWRLSDDDVTELAWRALWNCDNVLENIFLPPSDDKAAFMFSPADFIFAPNAIVNQAAGANLAN